VPGTRMAPARTAAVLAGAAYPAGTRQLLAQADYYGADTHTRAEFGRLPASAYPSLDAVLSALPAPRPSPPSPDHRPHRS
jgi:hypothetical protein